MSHIFELEPDRFSRRMDPTSTWREMSVKYLMTKHGISEEKAKEVINNAIDRKGFDDPIVEFYEKDLKTMDKKRSNIPLSLYLSSVNDKSLTIAPSFTCYTKVDVNGNPWVSTHSTMMSNNKELRSYHKGLAKKAHIAKDFVEKDIQRTIETSKKMGNNAYSGAACQLHLPFATHSSHYTFTSTTRVVTSTANVLSECILAGYRLYFEPVDVLNEWTSIIVYHDMDSVRLAIDTYGLVVPSADDLMGMVEYNKYYFWDNDEAFQNIRDFANTLSDVERTAIMYRMDMYHLLKMNEKVIGSLIDNVAASKSGITTDLSILDSATGYEMNLLYHILSEDVADKGLNHHKHAGTPLGDKMASTMYGIRTGFAKMKTLIDAFFKTEVLPVNIAHYKRAVRRAIALSDTDSTVGSYALIMMIRFGHAKVTPETIGFTATIATILSETVVNSLSLLSINMNVPKVKNHVLNMKSEYFFPFLAITNQSKHYLDLTMIKEMVVMLDEKVGFHGVSLISGLIDDRYNAYKKELANMLGDAITNGKTINPVSLIKDVIKLEYEIEDKVYNLDNSVLAYADIKDKGAYSKNPHQSPYFHYMLWNEVFAHKYGNSPEAPYITVKVPLLTDTPKRFSDFVNTIEDDYIREQFAAVTKKYGKKQIGSMQLPLSVVSDKGLPTELTGAVDVQRIILSQTSSIRLVLELAGIPMKDKVLVRDMYAF